MNGAGMVGGSLESSRNGAGRRGATESWSRRRKHRAAWPRGVARHGGLGLRALPSEHKNEIDGG